MKFPSFTKKSTHICPVCNKKVDLSKDWSEYNDPTKTTGFPAGYYHVECAPKLKHNNPTIEYISRMIRGEELTIKEEQNFMKSVWCDKHKIRCYECRSEDDLKIAVDKGGKEYLFCKNCYPKYVKNE